MITPVVSGAVRAMARCLQDAGLAPTDVGYINAHGTGTRANDRAECAAVRQVFGSDVPPMSSTKAMHGHLMGGAGAVELLACLMALNEGVLAPTISYLGQDADCAMDVVANVARTATVRATLSNSFAFGGMNAVIALKAL